MLVIAIGCGTDNGNMRVWGDVSYDGKPIEDGQIILVPVEATKGPSTGGPIAAGKYNLPKQSGPRANGTYRVEITAFGKNSRSYSPNASGKGPKVTVRDQFLPAKYNRESTLQMVVSPDAEANQHNFDLAK